MSKAKLVITAVVQARMTQAEAARRYGVSPGWVSKLMARYAAEGETAYQPRSRRPRSSPTATPPELTTAVLDERDRLVNAGHDAGPDTIAWHLRQSRPDPTIASHDRPDPDRARTRHARTEEETQVRLHPLRSRTTQRNLAIRLHPLPPHQRR